MTFKMVILGEAHIFRMYYWHGLRGEVKEYAKTYDICDMLEGSLLSQISEMEPVSRPFKTGTLDSIMGLTS